MYCVSQFSVNTVNLTEVGEGFNKKNYKLEHSAEVKGGGRGQEGSPRPNPVIWSRV